MANAKERLMADFTAKISEVNKTITDGKSAAEVDGKLAELSNIEKEYLGLREKEIFASLPDTLSAIRMHHFETISHKKESEEGRLVGVKASEKTVQIDLRKFCEFKSLPTDWWFELQACNLRLTMKVALAIGMKPADVKKINDSYAMDKLAAQIELGKTPESNTQCIKHIQTILDAVCPGAGKVNNYDLSYVMAGYTKRSNKESLKVVCSKHKILQSLLMDVFHNVVTGKGYGVDFKRKSADEHVQDVAEKTAEKTAKTSKPATKRGSKSKKVSASADEMVVAKEAA